MTKILVVDDEKITLKNLEHVLKKENYDVVATESGLEALKLIEEQPFDIVLTDIKMEKIDGFEILRKCKSLYPDTEVIMITGYATVENAVEAMREGAFYYISKPFKLEIIRKIIKEADEKINLKKEVKHLREQLDFHEKINIITQNSKMLKLLEIARQIAPTDCSVLITGESGTGKELFARYIHLNSLRKNRSFLAVNCGAFTEELLSNELFGHEKGAFTGATTFKKGLIEIASSGTLFLDEITEMSLTMQAKLLRVIQEKEFFRLGGTIPVHVDVRFIAATNKDIRDEVKKGKFREDLYYRLNVVNLEIPPLRERQDDIPLLVAYFLKKYSYLMKKNVTKISEEVLNILLNYKYPGNVRELENLIERAVVLCSSSQIAIEHLPDDLKELKIKVFTKKEGKFMTLEEVEREYIKWVLKEVYNNKTLAAQILGIDRVSLWRKIKNYRLEN
ncbi:MAG TPA: sigma-54 dependent transcriptional regulator [Thermodesulfovibrio thiophilus]|uniref:sigma-54-dependent transcriptional regulator n=1 Tax=Thermodesulfovibrio thiophilus TaxID=340095 RepID=UPI0017A85FAA|nr:sigma-54 dependent transcriptional regulator [Thermodesulfovibrio thiophilus]HHW20090.1 sigma-54-dependent Fis family transcriptional regulator [Thermodesulfovibrio thiophilus]HQA03908.1 sigma-54 dependent transcriptional regulator [Thermodesulfovibrio thiophilus]